MPVIIPLPTRNGSNSFIDFLTKLSEKHHHEERRYSAPLKRIISLFSDYGPMINHYFSKKFPPYKNLNNIVRGLAELRIKECRYFIFDSGEDGVYIGLHGYEKQSQDIPKNELIKAKGEIIKWKQMNPKQNEHLA